MATSADVPGKFDVVIDGHGYVFLDSLESSIPFRTHRAIYDFTPPFVERQNVSNGYGDDTQAFFLTLSQNDWSLGEQQKYLRSADAASPRRFYRGSAVDVRKPGQVTIRQATGTLTFTEAVSATCGVTSQTPAKNTVFCGGATTLFEVDAAGTVTSRGTHSLGAAPAKYGMCSDGSIVYLTAGGKHVIAWDGSSFSTFSTSGADAIAYLNNTLFGFVNSTGQLVRWDTAGTQTVLYTWQQAGGSAQDYRARVRAFGGQLAILIDRGVEGPELWMYDGSAPQIVWEMPQNFYANDIDIAYGVAFVAGSFVQSSAGSNTNMIARPAVLYYANGSTGTLWQADDYTTSTFTTLATGPHPGVAPFDNGVVFNDDTRGSIIYYDFSQGGVQTIGSYTVAGDTPLLAAAQRHFVHTRDQTTGYWYPNTATVASSATVKTSLIDLDSSLKKTFRGVTIDADIPSGATVDISYQVDTLAGSYTSLQTSAASGTEYLLSSVSGHSLSVQITLNKGSSATGPTLKRIYVRAAPQLPQYRSGTYILDCTNDTDAPRELRDGSYHPLVGFDQVQNLVATARSTVPFQVTDRLGTFTGLIDLNDQEGWDVYEVHPANDNPDKSGSFVVRLKCREV